MPWPETPPVSLWKTHDQGVFQASVALEVVENKGLKNTAVFFSVASFGKCFVFNWLVFSRRAKCTGKSVGFQGSTRTFDQAAVARDGLGSNHADLRNRGNWRIKW